MDDTLETWIIDLGMYTLEVYCKPDTDWDGQFTCWDVDTGEPLQVNGWLIDSNERIA